MFHKESSTSGGGSSFSSLLLGSSSPSSPIASFLSEESAARTFHDSNSVHAATRTSPLAPPPQQHNQGLSFNQRICLNSSMHSHQQMMLKFGQQQQQQQCMYPQPSLSNGQTTIGSFLDDMDLTLNIPQKKTAPLINSPSTSTSSSANQMVISPEMPCFLQLDINSILTELNMQEPTSPQHNFNPSVHMHDGSLKRSHSSSSVSTNQPQFTNEQQQQLMRQQGILHRMPSPSGSSSNCFVVPSSAGTRKLSLPPSQRKRSNSSGSANMSPVMTNTRRNVSGGVNKQRKTGTLVQETVTTTASSIQHSVEYPKKDLSFVNGLDAGVAIQNFSSSPPSNSSASNARNQSWTFYKEEAFENSDQKSKAKAGKDKFKFHNVSFVYVPNSD